MWCPLGPLVYFGCSAAACAARTGGTQGREALSAPWAPPPVRGTPQAMGSQTQPIWRRQSRSAGLTLVVRRTTALTTRQSWSDWVACPCDVAVASQSPCLPGGLSVRLSNPCWGLEHQAHISCAMHANAEQQWSKQVCHNPPHPTQTHKGSYTQVWRHLPPVSATAGSGGRQQSGRPCDRIPGCGRPFGSRREGSADCGLATR